MFALGAGAFLWAVALIAAGAIGVGLGALEHSRGAGEAWLRLLWFSSLLLLVLAVVAGFSIGLYLLPAVALALGASLIGSTLSLQAHR